MNLNESIGKRISKLRKEHHMTQEQLAERLDISIKHCSCVERGIAALSLERMLDVCDLFDVSMDYLVRGKSDTLTDIPPSVQELFDTNDKDEKKLLTEYLLFYKKLRK
ncbi:MAG: helix-turn-helix domain-containing protein [Clostridiales bacterium]|nr:helix-turn-helix domain-containing protein [Clostridiales bacterium]